VGGVRAAPFFLWPRATLVRRAPFLHCGMPDAVPGEPVALLGEGKIYSENR
jgi:hypothetical protein